MLEVSGAGKSSGQPTVESVPVTEPKTTDVSPQSSIYTSPKPESTRRRRQFDYQQTGSTDVSSGLRSRSIIKENSGDVSTGICVTPVTNNSSNKL
jgi:hypothetical protein